MNENDFRVIKTRENIETTFLTLLDQKAFSQITVGELISKCRISKGTFYYHYRDKYDLAEKLLKKQLAVYDEIFAQNQQTSSQKLSNVEPLVSTLINAAHIFHKLSSIQSTEFDARKECTDFLVNKFLTFLNQLDSTTMKNPYQVSRYLAAIVIAEAEMVSTGEAEAGPQFFETMQELANFIHYLQNSQGDGLGQL